MTTSCWMDVPDLVGANNATILDPAGAGVPYSEFRKILDELPDEGQESCALNAGKREQNHYWRGFSSPVGSTKPSFTASGYKQQRPGRGGQPNSGSHFHPYRRGRGTGYGGPNRGR